MHLPLQSAAEITGNMQLLKAAILLSLGKDLLSSPQNDIHTGPGLF